MRPFTLILAASLTANLFLIGTLVRGLVSGDNVFRENVSQPVADARPGEHPHPDGGRDASSEAPTLFGTGRAATVLPLWSRLYSGDLKQLAEGLRGAGFPKNEVMNILHTLIAERNNARRAKAMAASESSSYWRVPVVPELDRELQIELRNQMESDMRIVSEVSRDWQGGMDDQQRRTQISRRFGDLPEEKLQRLLQIEKDYGELRQQVGMASAAEGAAGLQKQNLLEQEYWRDIQAALTPEEYVQYQLRNSPTAYNLRSRLDPFQPTEQEFITLHALHEAFRPHISQSDGSDEAVRARQQAMEALNLQIETALGPERYADYQQTLLESSRRVNNLLVRLDLPLRTGGQIEDMRKDLTQRAEAVRTDASLTPAERAVRLGAIEQEARQRVSATLGGERNLAAYEDIKGWIRDLRPKAVP